MGGLFTAVFQLSLSIVRSEALKDHTNAKQPSLIGKERMLLFISVLCVCVFWVCGCMHAHATQPRWCLFWINNLVSAWGAILFFPSCFITAKFPCFQVNCKQDSSNSSRREKSAGFKIEHVKTPCLAKQTRFCWLEEWGVCGACVIGFYC